MGNWGSCDQLRKLHGQLRQLWWIEEVAWVIEADVISWGSCMGNWGSCDQLRNLHGQLRQLWSVEKFTWAIEAAVISWGSCMGNWGGCDELPQLQSIAEAKIKCSSCIKLQIWSFVQALDSRRRVYTFEEQLDEHFLNFVLCLLFILQDLSWPSKYRFYSNDINFFGTLDTVFLWQCGIRSSNWKWSLYMTIGIPVYMVTLSLLSFSLIFRGV
jgi:hypothetical protein